MKMKIKSLSWTILVYQILYSMPLTASLTVRLLWFSSLPKLPLRKLLTAPNNVKQITREELVALSFRCMSKSKRSLCLQGLFFYLGFTNAQVHPRSSLLPDTTDASHVHAATFLFWNFLVTTFNLERIEGWGLKSMNNKKYDADVWWEGLTFYKS